MRKFGFVISLTCAFVWANAQDPAQVFTKTDTQREIEYGREAYDYFKSLGSLSQNDAYVRRVQRILDQLQISLPKKLYPFHALVILDRTYNASCFPGGYILVHEGLLARVPQDEALAFILAHEMGHAIKRHWAKTQRSVQGDLIVDVLGVILTNGHYTAPDRFLRYQSYSRSHEYEADAFATELYLRAGYDPAKVTLCTEQMVEMDRKDKSDRTPEYVLSHPKSIHRLEAIKKLAKKLQDDGLVNKAVGSPIDIPFEAVFGKIPALTATGNPYLPMTAGTTWRYRVQSGKTETAYEIKCVGAADALTSKIARFEMIIGERTIPYQVLADESRIFRRNRPDKSESVWTVETAFPTLNSSVECDTGTFAYSGVEKIECPAGVYEQCLRMDFQDKAGRKLKVWFAPGVGMVKRVNETAGITEILYSFKPGA